MVLYDEAGELIQTGDEEMNLDINKKSGEGTKHNS